MKETKTPLEKAVLYVVLTIIAFIAIFPLLYIILASFRTNKEIFEYALPFTWKTLIPQNWTMDNYMAIFSEMGYGTALKNTLIVVAILVPLSMLISALGGFTFAFFDFKGKNILFAICLISFMVPEDAVALPLYNLISSLGMVNSYAALVFPGAASGLAMFLFTQFFCHSINLCYIFFAERRHNFYIVLQPGNVFALFKHSLHNFGCCRSPASVFNKTDGTILVITFCQVLNVCTHEWENIGVICNCSQNKFAITECIFHCFCHIFSCKIT